MDFRHLIVTCLFSMLRLSFETQKIKENYAILRWKSLMFTHDMKNRVYIGPDISKQPTLTCVQTEIRLSLLGGTAEMSAVSFFVYEPVTWLLTNRCLKIFFCRFIVHILPILIK